MLVNHSFLDNCAFWCRRWQQTQAHAAAGWELLTGKTGIGEEISEAHFDGFGGLRSGDERCDVVVRNPGERKGDKLSRGSDDDVAQRWRG